MLFIKDFRNTAKSYILTLQDSVTNELSEKIYDFNSEEFDGQAGVAALKMLKDIKNDKYRLSMNINANRKTAALLKILDQFRRYGHAVIDFNMFDNYSDSYFTDKYYGYYHDKDYKITYIADYEVDVLGKIKIVKIKETAKPDDESYDTIIKRHKKLIKKTGRFCGIKFHKFNRVQFFALTLITRKRIDISRL